MCDLYGKVSNLNLAILTEHSLGKGGFPVKISLLVKKQLKISLHHTVEH